MIRTLRHAAWTIGADREDPAPSARFVLCRDCETQSEPSTSQAATDRWALTHTGETGHRAYRELVIANLRTYPAAGNPLERSEEGS
jgi:hypothetical protein